MAERIDDLGRRDDITVVPADRGTTVQEDPQAIRADIEETRERMSHTLDEITDRLNPQHLKEQVKQNIREATVGRAENMARNAAYRVTETRHTIMDTIRDNPVPAAMVGIGLGWLFWNGRKEERAYTDRSDWSVGDRYYTGAAGAEPSATDRVRHRAEQMTGEVQDRAGELADRAQRTVSDAADRTRSAVSDAADRARETASGMADRAQEGARRLANQTRYRAHRLEDRFQDTLQESPLAVGAAALALGLVAGLAAPATETEVELMGDAREQLVNRVKEVAQEKTEQVQHVAERVMSQAQDAAQGMAQQAASTAKQAAKDEGLTSI